MITDKSVKHIENSQVELTITVDAATVENAYKATMAKYQKNLTLPGFRKGKAPVSVIENKYGEGIREESTFDCLEASLKECLDTLEAADKPLAYSTPVLQDEEKLLPFKANEGITFSVKYDVYPTVKVEAYKGLEIEVTGAEVTDADIDAEIEQIRDQNAIVKTKEGAIEKGDIVTLDYAELDEEGKEVESTKRNGFTFTLGTGYNYYKIDDELVGLKKGDEKVIEKTYAEDDATFAGKTLKISVKVDEVKFRELPEVDDDLAQDYKEEYETVADLKKGIREKLEAEVEEASKNGKIEALLAKILEKTEFDVPASMVDVELDSSWRNFVKQSGLDEKQLMKFFEMQGQTKEGILEEWRPSALKNIREQVILEEVKKAEDFAVDQEKFQKAVDEQLKNVEDESMLDYYKNMLKDEMQFAEVVPFLLANNTFKVTEKKSYKEFLNK